MCCVATVRRQHFIHVLCGDSEAETLYPCAVWRQWGGNTLSMCCVATVRRKHFIHVLCGDSEEETLYPCAVWRQWGGNTLSMCCVATVRRKHSRCINKYMTIIQISHQYSKLAKYQVIFLRWAWNGAVPVLNISISIWCLACVPVHYPRCFTWGESIDQYQRGKITFLGKTCSVFPEIGGQLAMYCTS